MRVEIGLKWAGLICVLTTALVVHCLVRPSHWKWGRQTEGYDSCLEYFGLGPLLLLVWPGGDSFWDAVRGRAPQGGK